MKSRKARRSRKGSKARRFRKFGGTTEPIQPIPPKNKTIDIQKKQGSLSRFSAFTKSKLGLPLSKSETDFKNQRRVVSDEWDKYYNANTAYEQTKANKKFSKSAAKPLTQKEIVDQENITRGIDYDSKFTYGYP